MMAIEQVANAQVMEESSIMTYTIMQQSLGFVPDCHVAMMANEQVPNAQVKEYHDFREKRASVPDLAHVHENMVRAYDFGQKTQQGATSCKTDFRAKTGIGTRPCSCT